MVTKRKQAGMDQRQLGVRVGTSQNIISLIESGKSGSSSFILKICKVLHIPVPTHFISEGQERWALLGHLLEEKSSPEFQAQLAALELRFVEELQRLDAAEVEEHKFRATATANIAPPTKRDGRPLRAADETPAEIAERKKKK